MHKQQTLVTSRCDANTITANGFLWPSYVRFGEVKIDCKTGEVTGISENISEDAKFFWEQVKEYIIGK